MEIINQLVELLVYIILPLIIPFAWWLGSGRKTSGFFAWVGLKKPVVQYKNNFILSLILIISVGTPAFIYISFLLNNIDTLSSGSGLMLATDQFLGKGTEALVPVLIWAFFKTAFWEEVFFRGFLAKQLINKFGFFIGNGIQGFLFALAHMPLITIIGWINGIIIFFVAGLAGCTYCWLNEKQCLGSIIPSWLIHGCSNAVAGLLVMFNILPS
ncbi:MAG: CPBP family intramembrane metalloprotease [Firmicutes bacterium]|nr:CPBP family intramembrane metalloprotease [Bacillota bacterium]